MKRKKARNKNKKKSFLYCLMNFKLKMSCEDIVVAVQCQEVKVIFL